MVNSHQENFVKDKLYSTQPWYDELKNIITEDCINIKQEFGEKDDSHMKGNNIQVLPNIPFFRIL